jgi:hypothetical protein
LEACNKTIKVCNETYAWGRKSMKLLKLLYAILYERGQLGSLIKGKGL